MMSTFHRLPLKIRANTAAIVPLRGDRHKLHSGGIDRAPRRICVISAALADASAAQKCQFGGIKGVSRLQFQRKFCNLRL